MPRNYHHPDGNFFRGKGHSYVAAEEALGIGIFILVLAILLIFGCWYYKRRSGYKSLRSKSSSVGTVRTVVGEGTMLDCKMAVQEYRNFNTVSCEKSKNLVDIGLYVSSVSNMMKKYEKMCEAHVPRRI